MKLIYNHITKTNHLEEVKLLLSSSRIRRVIISSAFATESGIFQIEEALKKITTKVDLFIGYANGVTDKETLQRAFRTNCSLYVVGLSSYLYHPKIYYVETYKGAKIIIGSANLTDAGLEEQYEASIYKELNLNKDKIFIKNIIDAHAKIKKKKETSFISSIDDIDQLDKAGYLKKTKTNPTVTSSKESSKKLKGISNKKLSGLLKKLPKKQKKPISLSNKKVNRANYYLVWKSGKLTARSLNIPKNPNTHVTGAMNLGKGDKYTAENFLNIPNAIAARNYFPKKVFKNLKPYKGRLVGKYFFNIEIFGQNHGRFNLEILHNPNIASTATGAQGNTANSIRWGDALQIIQNCKLLRKNLSIFKSINGKDYLISID